MRTFFKNIIVIVVLVLSLFSFETKGQIGSVYPVDLNVMLTPPYGTCLTDLSNSNRFVIQALLRDMNHGNNYEMLIQMRVKSLSSMNTVFLSYSNKFSIGMGKPAVVLGAGNTPVSISNFFESGNVLIGQNILNDNCLPEGAYLFCFQAFDAKAYYAKQRIPISKEFTVTAFLENGATPILISPANNDSLSCQMPNVIFQWQQPYITSGINSYTLQVAEANSPFDGPQIIENGGNLLIEKRGLMMPICGIPVTEANFKENHTYYWRVVMCDKEGKARASYPNKGASPVYKFVYCGTPQDPEPEDAWVPQIPMAKSIKKSLDRLRIDTVLSDESSCSAFWFQDPVDVREKYDGVVIEVKKKNQDTWTPFLMESKVATDTLVALSSLAYKETYMARGQYFLYEDGEKVYAPYSDTIEFKIPHPADTLECGNAAPELTDCTNAGERAELEIGDEFNANGTTVSIDTITYQSVNGSSVIISGEGHLPFPILSKFGLKVSFDNIEINCADELKKGQVISVYDEKTAAMIDLNNILGKGAAGNDLKQEDASLTEVGPDDDLSGFKSGDLIVEDGKVSLIVSNGNVVQVGTVIDLSNSDAYNDNGALNDEDIYVKFSNPDHENIAFDDDPTGMIRRAATLSGNYVSFGEEYIIPWVATNPGRIFQLTAMPSKDLSKSGFTDVKFVLPASGTHVVLDAVENGDGSYSVSIPGMKVDVQNQVYAIARKGEGSPYENVGKLNLCCYSYKSKKVVIVPLLEGLSVNTDEVKKDLDRVYAKLGYTFEVELDDDAAHREGLSTTIGLETDFLSDFSEEMKELIFNYEINIGDAYDKDAAYLFLLDKPTGKYKDAAGIMPQRQQYGFIFMREVTSATPSITHTMAHELGHGIFGLDHIFSGAYGIKKGATYNLMDYTEKTPNDALSYHEWTQINLPLPSWSALSRAEEDMMIALSDLNKISVNILSVDTTFAPGFGNFLSTFDWDEDGAVLNKKYKNESIKYICIFKDFKNNILKTIDIELGTNEVVWDGYFENSLTKKKDSLCRESGPYKLEVHLVIGKKLDTWSKRLESWDNIKDYIYERIFEDSVNFYHTKTDTIFNIYSREEAEAHALKVKIENEWNNTEDWLRNYFGRKISNYINFRKSWLYYFPDVEKLDSPLEYFVEYLVEDNFLDRKVRVNKAFIPVLRAVEDKLRERNIYDEMKSKYRNGMTFFVPRPVNNMGNSKNEYPKLSNHSYGCAVDFIPKKNPQIERKSKYVCFYVKQLTGMDITREGKTVEKLKDSHNSFKEHFANVDTTLLKQMFKDLSDYEKDDENIKPYDIEGVNFLLKSLYSSDNQVISVEMRSEVECKLSKMIQMIPKYSTVMFINETAREQGVLLTEKLKTIKENLHIAPNLILEEDYSAFSQSIISFKVNQRTFVNESLEKFGEKLIKDIRGVGFRSDIIKYGFCDIEKDLVDAFLSQSGIEFGGLYKRKIDPMHIGFSNATIKMIIEKQIKDMLNKKSNY